MDQRRSRIKIGKKKKIAFVCSGGAAKAGAFHLGVALALQEKGFKFVGGLKRDQVEMEDSAGRRVTVYVGSSAGSIICSYLASGYTLDQIFDSFLGKKRGGPDSRVLKRLTYTTMFSLRKEEGLFNTLSLLTEGAKLPALGRFVQSLAKDSYENLFKWRWLKLPGLFTTAGIERYLREDVLPSNDFQSYEADLFIVATQLNHSKKVVFGKFKYTPEDKTVTYVNETKISEACAASTALCPVFAPYAVKNDKGHNVYYFDGEIRDTLSTHVGYDAGADLVIASYTHQPYHFSREIGSLHQFGIPAILIQALYLMIERKIAQPMEAHARNAAALDATSRFFKEHNLPDNLRTQCLDLLERKLNFKRGVDYIYIHPKSSDHQMFFGDHFNLSGKKMSEIVRLGFRCSIDVLRRYDFE
ncbi:MAG: patatin-like phospholipase family protein [Deltaproteobacteria bacterium]|nr:patatin-like phospholipase family protein [Deltaproteobacteria bacterium]